MSRVFTKTSQYVPEQFPDFYRDDGPNFVAFVKEYYAWKDEISNRKKSRRILDYGDIDETEDEYLKHFIMKYMWGLPTNSLGDVRFLQKHVLDVYRSKGSVEGLRLLFRLLYGKDIQVYIPSKDMIAASDATYVQQKYLELSMSEYNVDLVQKRITGWSSGATAIAESYVEAVVRGRPVRLLYLSNIQGNFTVGERIYTSTVTPVQGPYILGSMVSFDNEDVIADSAIGNRYADATAYGAVKVSEISQLAGGTINFTLQNGGKGYTLGALVNVLAGGISTEGGDLLLTEASEYLDFIVPGTGVDFTVSSITDTEVLSVDTTIIAPYDGDTLNSATILYNLIISSEDLYSLTDEDGVSILLTEGSGVTLNDDVLIYQWEGLRSVTVGTIELIGVLSQGSSYIEDATVIVTEPFIADLMISDNAGGYYGSDAVVIGKVTPNEKSATAYKVESSGFGYYDGERIVLKYGNDEFLEIHSGEFLVTEMGEKICWGEDDSETLAGTVVVGPIGYMRGFWADNDGMLNSNKVIQDSYYYQEYSYDIKTDDAISMYEGVLRNIYHPVGVEMFGTTQSYVDNPGGHDVESDVVIAPYAG